MRPFIPAGIAAGFISTLLLAAIAAGSVLALPLFLAAPLPLAVAGFAFGSVSAAIGAVTLGIAAGLFVDPATGLIALLLVGLPVTTIVHYFGLSRAVGPNGATEWYPLGLILFRIAAIAAAGTILAGVVTGYDAVTLTAELQSDAAVWLDAAGMAADYAYVAWFVEAVVNFLPVTTAGFAIAMAVANAFLGASIAVGMGYAVRPRLAAWTVGLPWTASIIFIAGAIVASFAGPVGDVGAAIAGAFGTALLLVGLGIIHSFTRRIGARPLVLFLVYASIPLFGIPVLVYAALGILDTVVPLRPQNDTAGPLTRT
jgi:hypothetical protein